MAESGGAVFETPRTRTFLPVAAAAESFLHGTVGSRAARCGVLLLHGARCMRSLPKKFEARAVRFQIFVLRCEMFAWRAFFLLARTTTRFHRCETFWTACLRHLFKGKKRFTAKKRLDTST